MTTTPQELFIENFFTSEKNTPIFFVDVSGSTTGTMYQENNSTDIVTVVDYEFKLINQEAKKLGYTECHICCWSTQARMFKNVDLQNKKSLREIKNSIKDIVSGTHMMSGFNLVTDDMFDKEKITDFVILTDGEIQDSKKDIDQAIRSLATKNVTIRIIAVERGKKDYINQNCSVGNTLFQYIRESSMTRVVDSFSIYNALKTEFVNFYNPKVPEGYAPYSGNLIFKKTDLKQFMIFIDSEIKSMKDKYLQCLDTKVLKNNNILPEHNQRNDYSDNDSENSDRYDRVGVKLDESPELQQLKLTITKFTHELSLTIYHCTKDKSYCEQKGIIEIFSSMYQRFPAESGIYQMARQLLINEVNNHINGKATTFTDARRTRHLNVENTNIDLMQSVKKAINGLKTDEIYGSFLIRSDSKDSENVILNVNSSTELSSMRMDKMCYHESAMSIGDYKIPLLYQPGTDAGCTSSLVQWVRLLYSRILDISPSNPYIWYFVGIDGLMCRIGQRSNPEIGYQCTMYEKVIDAFMNEQIQGTEIKLIDRFIANRQINIDQNTLLRGSKYSGFNIKELTLFWIVVQTYVSPKISDVVKRNVFNRFLNTYCFPQISEDLMDDSLLIFSQMEPDSERESKIQHNVIAKIGEIGIKVFNITSKLIYVIDQHTITGTDIMCPCRIVVAPHTVCDICQSYVNVKTIEKTSDQTMDQINELLRKVKISNGDIKPMILNNTLITDLGTMNGEKTDTCLLSPDDFSTADEYMICKNTMIVDPISSTKMRITTQEQFLKRVHDKYPFLKGLTMNNVALAGGFCRSILCKQEMKDFDFFFYGLETDAEYQEMFEQTVIDLMNNVRNHYLKHRINIKFGMFFKPMFNVFELICYEDPTNHIDESFDLSDFHRYKFMSLKQYTGKIMRPWEKEDPKIADSDTESNEDSNEDSDEDQHDNDAESNDDSDEDQHDDDANVHIKPIKPKRGNDKYYFEDNDDHGIKMKHRFQFILCKYDSKFSIVDSFDMFPSKVIFDGQRVSFTDKSLRAYQYMINEIMLDGGSTLFKHRLAKYFKYGFAICFPPNDRNWNAEDHSNDYNRVDTHYQGSDENKGPLTFKIRKIYDNVIIVSHNSNIEKMLERNETLENNAKEEGKGLYLSSLFCSFVSILRYVDINGINYAFPKIPDIVFPETNDRTDDKKDSNGLPEPEQLSLSDIHFTDQGIQFKHETIKVEFKDRYDIHFKSREWFSDFYKGMILTDFDNADPNLSA